MIDKSQIEKAVELSIKDSDLFIVDINVTPANEITVEIDSMSPVDIDTCARITRAVEATLDRETEDFELEVGSAGLTAPFKVKRQYEKYIGQEIEILTRQGRKFTATLTNVGDNDFTVEYLTKVKEPGAKRPVMVTQHETIPFDMVKSARYHLSFK